MISTYLIVIVVLPIAAIVWESKRNGLHAFWQTVSNPQAVQALKLTFAAAFIVVLINGVLGTVTAWVLVRDDFRGKSIVNSIIDLPFALPTIVAGLTLLTLYGPNSPVGIDVAFTRTAVVLALCFVTLPFVIRTVQPVLKSVAEMYRSRFPTRALVTIDGPLFGGWRTVDKRWFDPNDGLMVGIEQAVGGPTG